MAGTKNDVIVAKNADFSQASAPNAQSSENNGLISNGQIWIGRSSVNAGGTHIDVRTLTAGSGVSITNGPGTITIGNTGSLADLHTAKFIVGDTSNGANYSTIAAAIAAASSGNTVFIQTGTYTENLTLKAGVNLSAYVCDGAAGDFASAVATNVIILGKLTASYTGVVSISGVMLKTNSDFAVVLSSANSTLNLFGCYLNGLNNTIISMTAAGRLNICNCNGDLGTTGITVFAQSNGGLVFTNCVFTNSGASTTVSTCSASSVSLSYCSFPVGITSSASGNCIILYSSILGAIILGSATTQIIEFSRITSGAASAISVSAGVSAIVHHTEISSSNTNAITGAGSITFGDLIFTSSSNLINTTTQVALITDLGEYKATKQPAFSASLSGNITNATGDGTTYAIAFDTEQFDQAANFAANTFTAPIAGKYQFNYQVSLGAIGAAHTDAIITIAGVNSTRVNSFLMQGAGGILTIGGSILVSLAASATVTMSITVSGGTKTVSVVSGTSGTTLQGHLVC